MKSETREESGALIISFEGDIDLQSSPEARKALLEAVGKGMAVLVDLSAVDYIDSSGVASLVESFQKAKTEHHKFILVSVSDSARRVLELARLDKVFTICGSISDALEA
ncbi:MAG: STAS domain-containing protein [Rhodospirillales bacterium]|jgi:anti-sigma B factor antagonist|nr:STAS domain-containing protein [Rhodospirillales bacterium]